jgi:hypothetical protein
MSKPEDGGISVKALLEPKHALRPSAFSVQAAEKWALRQSWRLSDDLFRLRAFWYINFVRQHVLGDRKTRYTMKLAQSENYGISVGLGRVLPAPGPNLIGKDARRILRNRLYRDYIDRTAFVDLIMGHISRSADQKIKLNGTAYGKYVARSRIFADEAEKICRRKDPKNPRGNKPRVLVIGSTAGVISTLVRRGFEVSATDLWPEAMGKVLGGLRVSSGKTDNARLMKEADLAIITGMTLPNRTLPSLMKLAKKHNTATMIWAVTGRNFGHYYTEHGVDCVISDPSPFLLLPGPATIGIWRRKK